MDFEPLEPEIRAALADQVEVELAKRSLSGALVYFLVVVAVGLSTNYYGEHPVVLSAAALLTFFTGARRLIAAKSLLRTPRGPLPRTRAKPLLLFAIYASFAVWGAFGSWTVHLYGGEWTAMFVLL